jgi:hypothetical protein
VAEKTYMQGKIFLFLEPTLQKWYILSETSAGWMRIPDTWIPDN